MSDHAELGPIDIQVFDRDEVGERDSGLTQTQALDLLQTEVAGSFTQHFLLLRSEGFPTKLAAQIAGDLTARSYEPIYAQLDPIRLGQNWRAVQITEAYSQRLQTPNVPPDSVAKLIAAYPSHSFVIDREEAATLFHKVRAPRAEEVELLDAIGPYIHFGRRLEAEEGKAAFGCIWPKKKPQVYVEPNDAGRRAGEASPAGGNGEEGEHDGEAARPSTEGAEKAIRANGSPASHGGEELTTDEGEHLSGEAAGARALSRSDAGAEGDGPSVSREWSMTWLAGVG